MTLLSLALVAALVAMQPANQQTTPQKPQPVKPDAQQPQKFRVRVVVASLESLTEQCEAGKFNGVDILVDSDETQNEPYHCPGKKLLPHKEAHSEPLTRVMLSYKAQDSVEWYSDTHEIGIASIVPHEDKAAKVAPKNPFSRLTFPTMKPAKSIESGPIIESAVNHRYKVHLSIGKRIIDPDVWCNP